MDQILVGILKSDKPDAIKKEFARRVIDAGSQAQPTSVVTNMFDATTRIILQSNSPFDVLTCKRVYQTWAKYNRSGFQDFFSCKMLHLLFEEPACNDQEMVWLLHTSMKMLRSPGNPLYENLCKVVEMRAIVFVREHPSFPTVNSFCQFLLDFRECIPKGEYTSTFCVSLIHTMGTFQAPITPETMRSYIRDVSYTVGGLLKHIWENADRDCINKCLRAIFNIIALINEGLEPSSALGAIVQYIPVQYVDTVTKTTVADTSIPDRNMTAALERMMDWLSWPTAKLIDVWLIAFLRGLAAVHKYTILIDVTENKIEQVYDRLHYPVIRSSALVVVSHMLLSFQHSPVPFHKIVQLVPHTLHKLQRESTEDSYRAQCHLAELMHCLMNLHPGFPDLYEPLLDALKNLPVPSVETIRLRLTQSKWTAQRSASSVSVYINGLRKSETGKTGLHNLGNTCFMNSIIQALFMCDSFRRQVLADPPHLQQNMLIKVQHVFALLSLTQRPAYSPSSFLQVSRPPWFTTGAQQDCSEFLKYFLDQMHEQERSKLKKDAIAGGSRPQGANDEEELASTLTQKAFGGKLITNYKCLKCKNESAHAESFTDIPLAFPSSESHKHVGRTTRATNAKVASLAGGSQTSTGGQKPNGQEGENCDVLALDDLFGHYLKPERLEGDNKYFCDRCKGLQDGERSMSIVQSPEYLILTLLRFSYDAKTQSRSKIFTDVTYPKILHVPRSTRSSNCGTLTRKHSSKSPTLKKSRPSKSPTHANLPWADQWDTYCLSAVVVHSGLSSDGGHYYCYARHSIPVEQAESGSKSPLADAQEDLLQNQWYLFNDSRVSYSSYESFSNVTKRFAKDTAYVLFYKKITPEETSLGTVDANRSIHTIEVDPPLSKRLREFVEKDNKSYLQEQELQERSRAMKQKSTPNTDTSAFYNWRDDDDGHGPPGNCGGGGVGGGLDGPRLVS